MKTLKFLWADFAYRVRCAFGYSSDEHARCWMKALDDAFGITGFANNRSWRLWLVTIEAHVTAALLRPIWWIRGW